MSGDARRCVKIKICGVTNEEDVRMVGAGGADYIGILVDMPSPRSVSPERALVLAGAASVAVVLLFQDAPVEKIASAARSIRPAAVQLQGDEPPEAARELKEKLSCEVWKTIHLPAETAAERGFVERAGAVMRAYASAGVDRFVLDSVVVTGGERRMGGTGKTHDWKTAAELVRISPVPVFLAGGLTPGNAARALDEVRPGGLDISSGVEKTVGKKDAALVRMFVQNAGKRLP
ncbi:MAG: phosphoribosylanthranilate isomerase [bacterium]